MEENSKLLSVCTVETDEEFLSSLDSESSDGDMGYDYIPQKLTGSQRLVRFFEARKYKQSAWTLMLCYALATTAEFVADNDFREAKMASMGQVARANFCSIAFFAQVLSLLTAVVLSLAAEGSFSFMRRVLTLNRMFHFGLIGIIFLASEGFYLAAGQASGAKLWSVVVPHVGIPVAAFFSQLYFKRPYTAMMWICFLMMTFSLCTFIALRERYRECPAFSDIRCGSREAALWIESNMNVRSLIYGFVGMNLNVMASILSERLFHTWKDNFAVLKINMDLAAAIAAGIAWALVNHSSSTVKKEFNAFERWGSWQFLDYVYVVVLVVWTWLQGLLIMKQSTVLKTMVSEITLITVTCILDLCSKDTYNFGVRMGPSLMLVLIVYMSFVLYRTAEVYEDERKYHVKAVAPSVEESEEEIQEEMEEWWHFESPWWGCYDKKIKGAPILPAEEDEAGGSAMDTQMLVISLVYAVTDTSRTLLNSYALSSSQINPNSMSFLSFLVGLLFASAMTWRSHGLGCNNGDEESQQKSTKGLLQAWNLRKIVDYGSSSLLQAVTMCLGNMAYAFGLSPPMAAVLGKVYTPVLAVGERVVLKKRRKGVEWIAVIILTLGTFSFLYLQIYDFEEGLGKAMKNLFPLILCIASACTSAFQALVSQGIYEANRDVDFYMNKVRFDAGSAAFTLLVVPLLSLTASRAKDIVWLPRTVDADCEVDHCWPKVASLSNGGSLHFPWSMESSMLTCTSDVCTGVCACHSGLLAGWGLQPALYGFLAISVLYGILVGIIYDKYGSLHRAKCDAFGLLLTYWIGNPLLNYLVKGESFGSSLSDVCLNIVSFIVPLAALATDFGKIMTTKMLQKVCSYRLGLVAGLLSRIRGKEVALLITEHEELDPSNSEAIIDLMDQRAVDMRKQGARVRLVDEQAKSLRAKLTMLFNSLPSHQKHEYHQLTEQMDGDPGVTRPTKVAIGVKTWGHNHHMVSMARHGVSASASGSGSLCQIRSLGFQETKDCKDALTKAANCHETLMKVSQDPSHQSHQLLLEQLRDNLVPPEPAPPFIQFLSEEH